MTTTLNIRIDNKIKDQITKKFASMGLGLSGGTKLIYNQFLKEKTVPVRIVKDTKKIRAQWDREVAQVIKSGKSYKNARELIKDLI